MRAKVALARRLAVIMHRIWIDGHQLPMDPRHAGRSAGPLVLIERRLLSLTTSSAETSGRTEGSGDIVQRSVLPHPRGKQAFLRLMRRAYF
jgi:hypothetical protein